MPALSDLQFGEFILNRQLRQLRKQGNVMPVSGKAFDLLAYMAENPGRPLLKSELLEAVWPETSVEEANLSQNVFLLRKILGSGDGPIKTLPGRGYQFAAQVAEAVPVADLPQTAPAATLQTTRVVLEAEYEEHIGRRNPSLPVLGVLIILIAAGWFTWWHWLNRSTGAPVQLVLTPVDGTTGDPILDSALLDALRMDLAQSPFVSTVSKSVVRSTLIQMMHKPDDPVTLAIARDICERTNSQAILHGTIARIGKYYLLTEEATSCVNGAVLAQAKQEAASAEDLPPSIDKLAEELRRRLGESRRSIARFDKELLPANTASLEALKDYTQGTIQAGQGKYNDAIGLLRKAVAADPGFAAAYFDLAANLISIEDFPAGREALIKAYDLRDSASEPIRLAIIALYHSRVTQDLYEAERTYRNWTEVYPRSAQAWNGLSVVQRELGHHADARIAAQHALDLRPAIQGMYTNLAYEQQQTGDLKGSLATCQRALTRGLDGDYIREHLLEIADALDDSALLQQQRDWAAAHPDAVFIRMQEVEIATTEGRSSDAQRLLMQANSLLRRQGMAATADMFLRAEGVNLIEAGEVEEGTRVFHSAPVDPKDEVSVVGLARTGDFAAALSALQAMQHEFPQGTLWNDYRAPEVLALAAFAKHKPGDAISALELSRPLEGKDPAIPMLRADAYRAAGQFGLAEQEYRRILQHAFSDRLAEEFPLSWLGLARTLNAEGNHPAALEAYRHFFNLWSHADPATPFLKQARMEYASLQAR